jgi:hypothetical protein
MFLMSDMEDPGPDPLSPGTASSPVDGRDEPVLAPGYQAYLLPGVPQARVRWRTVRCDGTRYGAVGDLGLIVAQVKALIRADGVAWVVGSDQHTIEVRTPANDSAGTVEVIGVGPRWSRNLAAALHR